ncbi:hypothetical protein [Sorangium sp. So ce204]|uniref:hypothetical protein n=1 Tax=Sorangium sp. So ce204 TaxID=3133288 RepID=UPI003F610FE4
MADLDSIGVPPDGGEFELPDPIPAEGVDARCRAIEIVEGPQLGALAVITEGPAGATRAWTSVGPGWEHGCQLARSDT